MACRLGAECRRFSRQSWKVRLHALPILSIVYYRELPLVDEEMAAKIMDVSGLTSIRSFPAIRADDASARRAVSGSMHA